MFSLPHILSTVKDKKHHTESSTAVTHLTREFRVTNTDQSF